MLVHLMPLAERSLDLVRRIVAVMVQTLPLVRLKVLDLKPLVETVQLSLLPLPHLLDLCEHLEYRQYCPGLVAVLSESCLAQGCGSFGMPLFLLQPLHWKECNQPYWLRLEEE